MTVPGPDGATSTFVVRRRPMASAASRAWDAAAVEGETPPGPARWGDVIFDGVSMALVLAGVIMALWSLAHGWLWAPAGMFCVAAGHRGLATGP